MTYTLRLLTAESRDLVVEALRSAAGQRAKVAQAAALELAPDRAARKDVRAASVRVTDLLAEAGRLNQLADELATADDVPLITGPPPSLAVDQPAHAVTLTGLEDAIARGDNQQAADELAALTDAVDDGLSDAAHAAAQLAGLEEARLDEDDPTLETGALAEDDVDVTDTAAAADAAVIDGAFR